MKLFKYSIFVILICSISLIIHAQEATEEPESGWEIVERCVGEPITSSDDWTFEGTILASGWAGIHGINASWDTPRVLHFETAPTNTGDRRQGAIVTPNHEYIEIFRGGSAEYGFYVS